MGGTKRQQERNDLSEAIREFLERRYPDCEQLDVAEATLEFLVEQGEFVKTGRTRPGPDGRMESVYVAVEFMREGSDPPKR